MKIALRLFCALCILVSCFNHIQAAPAADSGFQLTIELRDGSRVVGKNVDDTLSFHSSALGDMKLPWAGIRSIEYAAGTNNARLTVANGDVFTVQLAADTLQVDTGFGKTVLPVNLIRSVKVVVIGVPNIPAAAAAGQAVSQLTIELWDGSHVVGKGMDDSLNFHSSALGDLKLQWSGIRAIGYATTNADISQLTTTNGDVYAVRFVASTVNVETSFGKTELPVNLIRSINVSTTMAQFGLPSGLVALWSGESNALDSVGNNNGKLVGNVTYGNGRIGQAFMFDGGTQGGKEWVDVGNPASLQLQDFTITAWIQRDNALTVSGNGGSGMIFAYGTGGYGLYLNQQGIPILTKIGAYGVTGTKSDKGITDSNWHHLAVTKSGTTVVFYVDGVAYPAPAFDQEFVFSKSASIGGKNDGHGADNFLGIIDEVAIYNRPLSDSEIQAIYTQQNSAPLQPTSKIPRKVTTIDGSFHYEINSSTTTH